MKIPTEIESEKALSETVFCRKRKQEEKLVQGKATRYVSLCGQTYHEHRDMTTFQQKNIDESEWLDIFFVIRKICARKKYGQFMKSYPCIYQHSFQNMGQILTEK